MLQNSRGVLEAVEEGGRDALDVVHAGGEIPAEDDEVDLAAEIFGGDVVVDGIAQQVRNWMEVTEARLVAMPRRQMWWAGMPWAAA
jgi:methylmalonyl-CoA mutase cobalamin-binding subunit